MAPDGSVWVVLFGTNKLAHIEPDTLEFAEIDLPREGSRPRRLETAQAPSNPRDPTTSATPRPSPT